MSVVPLNISWEIFFEKSRSLILLLESLIMAREVQHVRFLKRKVHDLTRHLCFNFRQTLGTAGAAESIRRV